MLHVHSKQWINNIACPHKVQTSFETCPHRATHQHNGVHTKPWTSKTVSTQSHDPIIITGSTQSDEPARHVSTDIRGSREHTANLRDSYSILMFLLSKRERETDRQTYRETDWEIHTERYTDRQTDKGFFLNRIIKNIRKKNRIIKTWKISQCQILEKHW